MEEEQWGWGDEKKEDRLVTVRVMEKTKRGMLGLERGRRGRQREKI